MKQLTVFTLTSNRAYLLPQLFESLQRQASKEFVSLDYLYLLIDQDYDLKSIDDVFCRVEYQEDGSTKNIFKQYIGYPNGFACSRLFHFKIFKECFENAIHLVSSASFLNGFANLSWFLMPLVLIHLALINSSKKTEIILFY
ncbi:hypothetical protein [Acinetobacter sp. NS-4]|uniref:hypothetical protein n=1 Tax=Acinetobacter sp. NS-4 TaxID=3127956 RepID=UPI00307DD2A6